MVVRRPAKIVVIYNEKGGAGKTTTTCQLAGTLGHRGYDVLLADLDKQQASATWVGAAQGRNFPATIWPGQFYGDNTAAKLGEMADKYDVIVVDCAPGVENEGSWSALLCADMAIIPTKLSPADTNALPAALELAKKAWRELAKKGLSDFPVRILATAFRKGKKDQRLMLDELRSRHTYPEFKLFNTVLGDRVAFERSMLYGATAHSMPSSKEAIDDIEALADEVIKALKLGKPTKKD